MTRIPKPVKCSLCPKVIGFSFEGVLERIVCPDCLVGIARRAQKDPVEESEKDDE